MLYIFKEKDYQEFQMQQYKAITSFIDLDFYSKSI